jgi:outer membrane protein assembly factor BamB
MIRQKSLICLALLAMSTLTILNSSCGHTGHTVVTAPTISTTPIPATGTAHVTTLKNSATLSDGSSPTGTITFKLFDVTDSTCSLTPVDTETVAVNGNGTYTTPTGFLAATVGIYHWIVTYSGDSMNSGVSSVCSDEPVVVTATESVAYQINSAHSGYAPFGLPLAFPSSPTWSVKLGGAASYPVIADGKVFVLTAGSPLSTNGYGTQLYALDLATGSTVWGPVAIPGTYKWAGHTCEGGKVFVVNYDGLLQSFDAASGTPGWSVKLPGQYAFSAAPTAANGIVYIGGAGSGGTLYAVDEKNGNILWTAGVESGDESSPAISSDGVFVSYPCQVYKFDPVTGSQLWHYSGGCYGGGGKTVAYNNGSLYVRNPYIDFNAPIGYIFDAATGNISGNFGLKTFYMPMPAFGATDGFFLNGGTLQSENLTAQTVNWNFAGDGNLVSAPIVIDQVVIVGSSTGNVYAVDAQSGSNIWVGEAGSGILAPDEQNVAQPLTGFGAGEGYLVVPAGDVVTAWRLVAP